MDLIKEVEKQYLKEDISPLDPGMGMGPCKGG